MDATILDPNADTWSLDGNGYATDQTASDSGWNWGSFTNGIGSLLGTGLTAYGAVTQGQTAAQIAKINAQAAKDAAAAKNTAAIQTTSFMPWIFGGAAVFLVVVLVVMRRK